jgi:hypothetical protein
MNTHIHTRHKTEMYLEGMILYRVFLFYGETKGRH